MNNLVVVLVAAALAAPSEAFSAASLGPVQLGPLSLTPSRSCMNMVNSAMDISIVSPSSNYSATALSYFDDLPSTSTISQDATGVDMLLNSNSGHCVEAGLVEYCPTDNAPQHSESPFIESVLSSYIGPRVILALVAVLYGTNFPLGAIMEQSLPASAATSSRMVLASLVLSPFLLQLKPSLRTQVLIGGSFVSLGYISQSIALVDTSPAVVSFLGSATVMVCPILSWLVDRKPMGIKDAPQTWLVCIVAVLLLLLLLISCSSTIDLTDSISYVHLYLFMQAAFLCLSGVAALELFDSSADASATFSLAESVSRLGTGDALSLVQAVGFGTGIVSCHNDLLLLKS